MSTTANDEWMNDALDKLNDTLKNAQEAARRRDNIQTLKDLLAMQLALYEVREIAAVAMAYRAN